MDGTVVAVFDNPDSAENARRDLIARQFIEDRDVSIVRQRAVVISKGPWQWLKGLFGGLPPLRERAVLTVYAAGDNLRKAERTLREHRPTDIQVQLADPPEPTAASAQQ
jgi:hypothetical protein